MLYLLYMLKCIFMQCISNGESHCAVTLLLGINGLNNKNIQFKYTSCKRQVI